METNKKTLIKVPILDLQKKYDGRAFNMQINNTGDQPVRVRLFGNGQTFAEVVDQEEQGGATQGVVRAVTTMPDLSQGLPKGYQVNDVVQYIGTSVQSYANGFFYRLIDMGEFMPISVRYQWVATDNNTLKRLILKFDETNIDSIYNGGFNDGDIFLWCGTDKYEVSSIRLDISYEPEGNILRKNYFYELHLGITPYANRLGKINGSDIFKVIKTLDDLSTLARMYNSVEYPIPFIWMGDETDTSEQSFSIALSDPKLRKGGLYYINQLSSTPDSTYLGMPIRVVDVLPTASAETVGMIFMTSDGSFYKGTENASMQTYEFTKMQFDVVDVTFEEFQQLREQDNIEFGKYYHITDYRSVVNNEHLSILIRPNEIIPPDLLITINKDGKYTGWYGDSKIIYTPEKCNYLWDEPQISINIDGIDYYMNRYYEGDKTINNKWYYCFMYLDAITFLTTYYYFPKELDSESNITYYQSQTGPSDLLEKQGLVLPSVDYTYAISYKGAILRLTDIYGNSFPFDFLHIGLKTDQPAPYDFKLIFMGYNDRARNVIWEGDIDYDFIIGLNPIIPSEIIQFENIVFKSGCKNISGILDDGQSLRRNITFENDVKNISLISTTVMSVSDGYLQNITITSGDYKDSNDQPQTVTIDRNRNYVTTVGLTSLGQVQTKNLMD